jgi:GTP-binding protein
MNIATRTDLRNVAIIAHVDHGKTTLVDAILKQTETLNERKETVERVMDSMDLERERGITIRAKNASITHNNTKINIIDTPGHADFGGEVERTLRMADGVLLLVDAAEGPQPQTKYVLSKALELGLKAIVVMNKIDRPEAQAEVVEEKTFELFLELNADEHQLEYTTVYASAVQGYASLDRDARSGNLTPLLDIIVDQVPEPKIRADEPPQLLVLALQENPYLGKMGIGKLEAGCLKKGQKAIQIQHDGTKVQGVITELVVYQGLERTAVEVVDAGEIVAVAGFETISIGETITDAEDPRRLEPVQIDEPTMQMTFGVNTSPFSGNEGEYCTSRLLRQRLKKEIETNVSLRVSPTESPDQFLVAGRGELHLGILIETLRREGFELQVSQPQVLLKEIDGVESEPMEVLTLEVPEAYSGVVMEELGERRGQWKDMAPTSEGTLRYTFAITTRNLIGLKSYLLTRTNGTVIMHHRFDSYQPKQKARKRRPHGSLVSMEAGTTTAYALFNLQDRGTMFIAPNTNVYNGMVIGRHIRDQDLEINPTKAKQLTNMRASGSDDNMILAPPHIMSLDVALEYIGPDELVEVTPKSIRIRKLHLNPHERKRFIKSEK